MEAEPLRLPPGAPGRALAGVFDPRLTAAGEALRERLERALEPDGGPSGRFDGGGLSVAWTGGIDCHRPPGGSLCLFDGHLYNRAELTEGLDLAAEIGAAALLARGHAALGTELLPRLRGDFTFLIWDPAASSRLLARDQLGGRGLFVHRLPHGIAFASEVRNLVAMLSRTPGPDEVAIANHLVSGMVPENRTFYSGIAEVSPATVLEFGQDGARATRYWTPSHSSRRGLSVSEAAECSRGLIERAVARRAAAGTETAILLSGGIDSAAVAGVAARLLPPEQRPTRAYSAIFPRYPEIDEARLIAIVAADTGLEATGMDVGPGGMLRAALPYISTWLAPPTTPNLSFMRLLLDRATEDGTRFLLDGEGGDALFWHSAPLLAHRLRRGRLLSAWSLAGRFPEYGIPTTWRTRVDRLWQVGRKRDSAPAPQPWVSVSPELLEVEPGQRLCGDGPSWWREWVEGILGPGSRMVHDITRRGGALSGIEPRHPLLDVDLIEEALAFPPGLAFDRRYNRPVLRDAVAGYVPDEVRLRPYKSNFDAVIAAGTDADLPVLRALLLDPGAHVAAYTDSGAVGELLDERPGDQGERRMRANSLWRLAAIECLLRVQAGEVILPAAALNVIRSPGFSFSGL